MTCLVTHLTDLVRCGGCRGLTHLTLGTFWTFTLIEGASKWPSFGLNVLLSFRSNTFKVVWFLASGTKDPFRTVMTISKHNIVICKKTGLQCRFGPLPLHYICSTSTPNRHMHRNAGKGPIEWGLFVILKQQQRVGHYQAGHFFFHRWLGH